MKRFEPAHLKAQQSETHIATFAGGCFWCMQPPFAGLRGIISTQVGYTGGKTPNPTYDKVASGLSGHIEAIEIRYDPTILSFTKLLDIFWINIDPTQANRQFNDIGTQYQTAIFYHNDEQKRLAGLSKEKLEASGLYPSPIVTRILPADTFTIAEGAHQKYYEKNPTHYNLYKVASGREAYIKEMSKNRQKDP